MTHALSRSFSPLNLTALALLALVAGTVGCNGSNTGSGNDSGACSTDSYWTGGNEESELMNPGEACIACHSRGEGPTFTAAGTVMGDFADPNDCNGVDSVTVRLTDADGVVHEETTNSAGNFSFRQAIAMPYTAEIENTNGVSAMSGAQSDGDCASCHTAEGANGAPGRIVAP